MPHALSSIEYKADHSTFLARAKIVAKAKASEQRQILHGFPTKVESKMVWDNARFKAEEWVIHLTSAHLDEIDSALRMFQGLRIPMGFISPETFPLRSLGPLIKDVVAPDIYNGKGFAVLRGIPVQQYTELENSIIHAGLASWLGRLRGRQDKSGNLVVRHIKDVASAKVDIPIGTAQYTSDSQAFHTDFGDVVSLYCTGTPAHGGTSHLASLGQVYNELCQSRPDVIQVLAGEWPFATFDHQAYAPRPLLFFHGGHLIMQYSRRLFTGFGDYRNDAVSKALTMAQMDAMDNLEFLARKHCLSMNLQQGDVQWVNNLGILHSRDSYQDDHFHRRELQRLWIRNEELSWDIPKGLRSLWTHIFYSMKLQDQEFFPPESRIVARDSQRNGWTGKAENPKGNESIGNMRGDEWVSKLKGNEWVAKPATNLKGDEWVAKLKGDEWVAKLKGDEWVAKLKGDEWVAKLATNLKGDEWVTKPVTTLKGDEWVAKLKGDEWVAKPAATLKGDEWVAKLKGDEWVAKLGTTLKGDEWVAKLEGDEWVAKPAPTLKGDEWVSDEWVAKPAITLKGDEWIAKLKGDEWVAKPATTLKGEEWVTKLGGDEWVAKPTITLKGDEWVTKLEGDEWVAKPATTLKGDEWVTKLEGNEWVAKPATTLKGDEWVTKLEGGEWMAKPVLTLKGDEWVTKLEGDEWVAKPVTTLKGDEWITKLKGDEWVARPAPTLKGDEWVAKPTTDLKGDEWVTKLATTLKGDEWVTKLGGDEWVAKLEGDEWVASNN